VAPYLLGDLPPEIAARIIPSPETGCWEWQHRDPPHSDPERYGSVLWAGQLYPVHRLVYTLLEGPIPDGRPHLDHVYDWGCRARSCCWPAHLDPVTPAENQRRMQLAEAKRRRDLAAVLGDPDDVVGMAEVVRITGYSRSTLGLWRRQAAGPPTRLSGRRRLARRGDVLEWLAGYDAEHRIPDRAA